MDTVWIDTVERRDRNRSLIADHSDIYRYMILLPMESEQEGGAPHYRARNPGPYDPPQFNASVACPNAA